MDDEQHKPGAVMIPEDRELTKPKELPKDQVRLRQLSVRIHPHEHEMLRIILKRDGMSLQKFHNYIVSGYLNADPRVLAFIREQRELERIPKDISDKRTLSMRERNNIFDEIANGEKDGI